MSNQPNEPRPNTNQKEHSPVNSDRGSRKFRGIWIPAEIWEHEELTIQQKVFLAEIDSLSGRKGCYASNGYFSKFFGLSKSRVSNVISSLEKTGLIEVTLIRSESGRNIEKRIIKPTGYDRPIVMRVSSDKKVDRKSTTEKFPRHINAIVLMLNAEARTQYKDTSIATRRHINARLNEGFKLDDFKTVILDRIKAWSNDDKMKQYIRPETLFGTKFESYLNNANRNQVVKKTTSDVNFGERATDEVK